uniref:Lysophospholipid acyltransferase n=1 Tax=Cryptococcus bacillisporus CA1280 TaxID=1296109 RepID=A0A0D0TUZ1_CRYGA|nr:lysophospholipid acyltransferase [Cryptococcus bacillisporus CA1280]
MFWDPLFTALSKVVGAPTDQLKLIFSLLVAFPLGSIFVRLPSAHPNVAHLFSIAISTVFLAPLLGLGEGMLHMLFSSLGTYVIVNSMRGKSMPWVVFAFVMGHLLFNHIKRSVLELPASTIEITGSQMVLVMKLSTFAWNIHDGGVKEDELDANQLETRLTEIPSLVAFLGYCFFFPSVLVGPSFDYATYDALIHKRLYSSPPPGSSPEQAKATKRRIPYGRKRVAYLHLVIGLFFLGVYALYGDKYSYENVLNPIWTGWGWTRKLGFVQLAGLLARTKYYAVWSLSEGACILTGIGFNGYDHKTGRTLWNRVRNINIKGIETAESFKILFDSWNCRTNVWLRDVVYKRVTKKGKKPGFKESMATFLTSAFWHGISPGYYLAFFMGGLVTSLGRQFRRYVRPYFLPLSETAQPGLAKRVYDLIGWISVQSILNYLVAPFLLLDFKDSIGAWNRMYWYGHVAIIISMCFMSFGGRKALKRGLDKRKSRIPPSVKVSPPSPPIDHTPPPPPEDEMDSTDLRWVKHDLDNPEDQDSGEGVAMGVAIRDHGFLDKWIEGEETPGSTPGGTPKYEKDDPLQE